MHMPYMCFGGYELWLVLELKPLNDKQKNRNIYPQSPLETVTLSPIYAMMIL